jgi:threonyl-tRNA synthetase
VWIAPVQAIILTVTDRHLEYARQVFDVLREKGMRVELDDRNEKLGFKIREAQLQKIPYMLVIGDREMQAGTVAPRRRDGVQLDPMSIEAFCELVDKECLAATKGRLGMRVI